MNNKTESAGPTGTELSVCKDIAERQELGIQKYGCTVRDNPLSLRMWLKHAYEEGLDQTIYLRRAMEEMGEQSQFEKMIDNVRQWGVDKGITGLTGKATLLSQLEKTQEELIETRDAAVRLVSRRNSAAEVHAYLRDIEDGIGDQVVTLILAAELAGLRFEHCLERAYNEIKNRTGKMVNGQFVKDGGNAVGL